ncbi:g5277 [Coccomyxa viridis]|uniref:G5274 protein n=1 Tax=Coccomyxa viridis TaxID=1274662 RepID=A0ABP1FSE7_9CHLO
MNQRIQEHVPNRDLEQHFKKAKEDGLCISSVACCHELWTLVVDAGTGFSAQVYMLSSLDFLPSQWIASCWDEGFNITAVAGSFEGFSLVVMSRGTPYTHQTYKVSKVFPVQWIRRKWAKSYYVTSVAHSNMRWAIVMSRNAGFVYQSIELDFRHPSEGHLKWACGGLGLKVTAVAATPDRIAAVLSRSKQNADFGFQRVWTPSTGFNIARVRECWANNKYITGIAYGRTLT